MEPRVPAVNTAGAQSTMNVREIKQKKKRVSQPPSANKGFIAKHPFRCYIIGASQSGKTNLMLNLLSRKDMYKGFFDLIYVLSPTAGKIDKTYNILKLPEQNYFKCDPKVLERILQIQKKIITNRKKKPPKILIILDDCISFTQFMNSQILLEFATQSRHYNISMFILSQAYHRVNKSVRLSMSWICFFRSSQKELTVLAEDFCPAGFSHKQFKKVINKATAEKYSFLNIDLNRPLEERYKRNLQLKNILDDVNTN